MRKSPLRASLFSGLVVLSCCVADAAAGSQWHGYDREDFTIDHLKCYLVKPNKPAADRPWIWRARFPDYHPEVDLILLQRGFHIAYINTNGMLGCDQALDHWDRFYAHVIRRYGLAKKVALEGVSRGGLFVYRWAARNSDKVACIYADTPVCDFKSWPLGQGRGNGDRATWQNLLKIYGLTEIEAMAYKRNPIDLLEPIVKSGVPILHIISENDMVVPPAENTQVLEQRCRELGGYMRVMRVKKGTPESSGHHFTHPDPLTPAEFIGNHTIGPKDWFTLRGALDNCRLKFERDKKGRVVFLGGSITHMSGWRDMVCADLQRRFPQTTFDFVNAGISSTGSTPGAFRLMRDVFGQRPVDLLFEEAAVNDSTNYRTPKQILRGMEGIVRHARLVNPNLDIVMMHFVDPSKMADYNGGMEPVVISKHEQVARHYRVSTINLALEVTQRINAGEFTWKEDFKDIHPSPFGQKLYFNTIKRFLDYAWSNPLPADVMRTAHPMPEPLDPFSYYHGQLVAVDQAEFDRGWKLDPRWKPGDQAGTREGFVDVPVLLAEQPGATLRFKFTGSAAGIFVAAGPDAGTIEYRVDDGPWHRQDLFTPWSHRLHLPWAYVLATEMADEPHSLTIRIDDSKNPNSQGYAVRIVHFLVNESYQRSSGN